MKRAGPLPPTYLLASLVLMVLLHLLMPIARIIALPWSLLGFLPALAGVILNLLADSSFKRARTTVKSFDTPTVLITAGVFRLSRNPMYLGFALILLGLAVLLGTLLPFVIVVLFSLFVDRWFIAFEERMLLKEFGNKWLEYRKQVRRWL